MITRRRLAAFGGLITGAVAVKAAAQGDIGKSVPRDGAALFSRLDGAHIPRDVVSLRTAGDTSVGLGEARFSERRTGSPYARTFRAADGRTFEMLPGETGWSVAAFGAVPGGDASTNRRAIQAAIDHACWLERNNFGTHAVLIEPGQYDIDGALQVFAFQKDGSLFNVSLTLFSPARGYTDQRTQIRNTRLDQPTLMIAKARSVNIRGITFKGAGHNYNPTYLELVGDASWSNNGRMRDEVWTPACGIVIDPFGTTAPPGGGWPGFERVYNPNLNGTSSNIRIEDCEVVNFPVGILISPSTDGQLGDSITIRDCNLSYNTCAVATCQSQNRAVNVESCRIHACYVGFSTDQFGAQDGAFPDATGLNVTYCKYLFSGSTTIGSGSISRSDVEATFSLGAIQSGAFVFSIIDCHIKLLPHNVMYPPYPVGSDSGYSPGVDYQLYASGPVHFYGGYFGFYSNVAVPLSIAGGGQVSFFGTALDAPVMAATPDTVSYNDVPLRYMNGGNRYGVRRAFTVESEGLLANKVDAKMPPDGTASFGSAENGDYSRYRNSQGHIVTALTDAPVAVAVTGDGRASFTAPSPGRFMVGEWLGANEFLNIVLPNAAMAKTRRTAIGQVERIDARTGQVSLRCVPPGLAAGRYTLVTQSLPSFRRRCFGAATRGSRVLTGIPVVDHGIAVGDRLLPHAGIPAGAWVEAVDTGANTITISLPATSTAISMIRTATLTLEDAPRFGSPANAVTFVGDFFRNQNPTVDANGRLLEGWMATSIGNPGTLTPIYRSTRSQAS